ncbi:RNA polymerase subunit sigma-70 [Zobellella endophytica]|uniref:RNA polymerase subunit sigma-70 n=1 Tax=Zobellella endophytica TaxID=2116700 RepID=A0A2P7R7G1_9GAMM|nr:RNA polymerase sigma factor [Zobellella endophytica]PSJ46158.1 RNA polymerase subunit sigma-70 [Zobellella endophytica]
MQPEIESDIRTQLVGLQPRLRRFALGLTGSLDEADELVQCAYERALSHLDQWQQGSRLDSWMFRIIQNLWLNQLRANRVRRPAENVDPEVLGGELEEASWETSLLLRRMRQGLQRLPGDQRLALMLVVVEGLSYKDAATVMELPVGTLTSRLGRARKALSDILNGRPGLCGDGRRERGNKGGDDERD